MKKTPVVLLIGAFACCSLVSLASAQTLPGVTAGSNQSQEPTHLTIPFDPQFDHWLVEYQLTFVPSAGPMEKWFQTPPTLLEPGAAFPVWEQFALTPNSLPVSDWHEEILTPGWEWIIPPPESTSESLITRDGVPWPWQPQIPPTGGTDPSMIWVEFPPIDPPHILDVHKQLLWVGTPSNPLWGDDSIELQGILVREYPTPEPATLTLLALGGLAALRRRR